MSCISECTPDPTPPPTAIQRENASVFLIRTASGNVVYPPINIYESFEESCKQYKVIGEEGKLTRGIVNENLEYVLQKREDDVEKDREQDSFQLGQIMYDKGRYAQALKHFQTAVLKYYDPRAKYQIAVMLFDDLLERGDRLQYQNPQKAAYFMMEDLLSLDRNIGYPLGNAEIVDAAAYNMYLAHMQGWGVEQSQDLALKYLRISATRGDTRVSVFAQTTLGYFFATPENFDIAKVLYWHSEACGNGSVESQAVIGVLYMFGLGVKKDWCSALQCLRDASDRGNVFAKGILSLLYFQRKLYSNASRTACSLALNTDLRNEILADAERKTFSRRGLAVACFIYATCLDRGLGVAKDKRIAGAMYSRCIHVDPTTTSRLQNMVIREEI